MLGVLESEDAHHAEDHDDGAEAARRAGAGFEPWSGHMIPTAVRMAQSGQIGVSQVAQVSRVGRRWRVQVSSGAPSTAGKASECAVGRLPNHG